MNSIIDQGRMAVLVSAAALLLAACGNTAPKADATAPAEEVADVMPAEEGMGDMGMDMSATDATADAAPPADPMMGAPEAAPAAQ